MRKTTSFILTAVIACAVLWGCKGKQDAGTPAQQAPAPAVSAGDAAPAIKKRADAAAGKAIYVKYCHFCHGQKGLGDGPVGLAITPHPADFVNDAKRMSKTDDELFKSITDGIKREIGGDAMFMPGWKEILTEKERWDVLSYVRQLEREGKAAKR